MDKRERTGLELDGVEGVDWLREEPAIDVAKKPTAGDNWFAEHGKEIVEGTMNRADSRRNSGGSPPPSSDDSPGGSRWRRLAELPLKFKESRPVCPACRGATKAKSAEVPNGCFAGPMCGTKSCPPIIKIDEALQSASLGRGLKSSVIPSRFTHEYGDTSRTDALEVVLVSSRARLSRCKIFDIDFQARMVINVRCFHFVIWTSSILSMQLGRRPRAPALPLSPLTYRHSVLPPKSCLWATSPELKPIALHAKIVNGLVMERKDCGFQKDESDAPAFPIFASEDLGIGAIIVISPRKTTCFFATFSHFLHPLILVQDSSLPPGPPSPSTRMMSLF
ncbi:predicted protein [Histoplasma capsulatum G186AR]|uniref:Uncharacterized protein n=1 Tax=Ajellomyces capsulatus (strain G186AR / H82 / ATCC MYA-2454 / RMSCC 2432) TaxID=447093 RepID=C0NDT7_AJECG|nr:uncharacterized protein HCBG_02030 [Histoplasma capsulatum G186AR]EEH10385.1 predicted protein [Histoplasma capsulatum G186AR]